MHLWHGFVVTPGPMVATNLEYNTRDKKFTFGFGVELERLQMLQIKQDKVSADYKEFSIYTVYRFTDNFLSKQLLIITTLV
jgi:hypothetical protein